LERNGGDGTSGLRGLSVRLGGTSRVDVDTGDGDVSGLAHFEFTWGEAATNGILGRAVVSETNTIQGVLAVTSVVVASWVTDLQAELVGADELSPPVDLVSGWVKGRGVHETTDGVTTLILSSGVELASVVTALDVDQSLVNETSDHPIVIVLEELNTLKGTSGDDTGTVTGLSAPGDFLTLGIGDERVGGVGCPQAEVIDAVEVRGLAHGGLTLGGGVADVVTSLGTTDVRSRSREDLVRGICGLGVLQVDEGCSWELKSGLGHGDGSRGDSDEGRKSVGSH